MSAWHIEPDGFRAGCEDAGVEVEGHTVGEGRASRSRIERCQRRAGVQVNAVGCVPCARLHSGVAGGDFARQQWREQDAIVSSFRLFAGDDDFEAVGGQGRDLFQKSQASHAIANDEQARFWPAFSGDHLDFAHAPSVTSAKSSGGSNTALHSQVEAVVNVIASGVPVAVNE